jgi:hypothetical protein
MLATHYRKAVPGRLVKPNLGLTTIKGLNVTRQINSKWADLWNTWNWESWIRPQIDLAVTYGANCIKITASGINPEDGFSYPADAVLKARIEQVCGYAQARGMVVYWNLLAHPFYGFGAGGTSLTANLPQIQKVTSWLREIPNVVAIDVCNEINNSPPPSWGGNNYAQMQTDLAALFAGVRAVTSLPLTCSVLCQAVSDITGPYMSTVAPLVDFHDFHPYYTGATPAVSDVTALRAAPWYKGRYLIGEIGTSLAQTASVQTTWTTNLGAMGAQADSFGTVLFCAADYDNATTSVQFGICDIAVKNPRSQITTPFSAWTAKF